MARDNLDVPKRVRRELHSEVSGKLVQFKLINMPQKTEQKDINDERTKPAGSTYYDDIVEVSQKAYSELTSEQKKQINEMAAKLPVPRKRTEEPFVYIYAAKKLGIDMLGGYPYVFPDSFIAYMEGISKEDVLRGCTSKEDVERQKSK